MKAATLFLFCCLFVGVVFAKHTKSHKAREGTSDGAGAVASGAGGWPSPGTLGSFDVPSSFTQDLGEQAAEEGGDSESEGKSAKRKTRKH